jgi:hypothetical protein
MQLPLNISVFTPDRARNGEGRYPQSRSLRVLPHGTPLSLQ